MNLSARRTACLLLLLFTTGVAGCDIPVLESPQCSAAQDAAREFYSTHFGKPASDQQQSLKARERFLTSELISQLSQRTEGTETDYFTATTGDFPKAFRVGACRSATDSRAEIDVLLFWRDDVRSEQRTILVEAINRDGRWLINKVTGN